MKKFFMLAVAAVLCMPATFAQNQKALDKALQKEFKLKKKELSKGNWELFGSSRSLDVALLKHYDKLNATDGDDVYEIMGTVTKTKSKNIGHQACLTNAQIYYAQMAGAEIKGRIVKDMASNDIDTDSEFDHFYAAYESLVEKEIKGELQESFSVIRQNNDGTFEIQAYYVLSESAATRARIRAYENAMKESEAAQRYAKKVSDFVREGFNASGKADSAE